MKTIYNCDPTGDTLALPDSETFVEYGASVDVDDDLAGAAPSGEPDDEEYDPGSGLLAQPGRWSTEAPGPLPVHPPDPELAERRAAAKAGRKRNTAVEVPADGTMSPPITNDDADDGEGGPKE